MSLPLEVFGDLIFNRFVAPAFRRALLIREDARLKAGATRPIGCQTTSFSYPIWLNDRPK
jgi:hypothetical protein